MPRHSTKPASMADSKPKSEDALEKELPARIKSLRVSAGLTAADLDRLTDLGAGTIGRLERGTQRIYASHLYRIAQATGVDVTWFYDEHGIPAAAASPTELEKRRLLNAYMRITDNSLKRDVYELLKTLADSIDD